MKKVYWSDLASLSDAFESILSELASIGLCVCDELRTQALFDFESGYEQSPSRESVCEYVKRVRKETIETLKSHIV